MLTSPRPGWVAVALALPFAAAAPASATHIETLRFDLVDIPLAVFNLEFVQDFLMPPEQFTLVSTRLNLNFNTETSFGTFDAANFGLLLNPPVQDPESPSGLVFEFFTGADLGWSGSGQFTYFEEFDRHNGLSVLPPPDSGGLLYAIQYFHAERLDGQSGSPMGGVLTDSWVEVDFIIPAPPSAGLAFGAIGALTRRRRRG